MNTRISTPNRSRAQRGFTLVELMIAILIGVFLAAGLMTLVSSMKRTSGAQAGLSNLQENERLAMSILTDVIQSAGYWPNPTAKTASQAFVATGSFAAGQTIFGTNSATAPGDSISIRYATGGTTAGNDNVINCTGSGTTAAATFINTFKLVDDPNDSDATHMVLQCSLTLNGVVQTPPVTLVNGVTDLQILYGVQSNGSASGNSVDAYVDAGAITDWSKIISVKISLKFVNPLAGQPGQPAVGTPIVFTRIVNVMNKAGVST